jgi:hypothetical protein
MRGLFFLGVILKEDASRYQYEDPHPTKHLKCLEQFVMRT